MVPTPKYKLSVPASVKVSHLMGYFSYSLILGNFIIFLLVLGATCFYDTWLCLFHSTLDYSLKEHGDDPFNLLIIF